MKCHYIYTPEGEKVLIPGCWGTVVWGIEHCHCPGEPSNDKRVLRREIKALEQENTEMDQSISELTGRGVRITRKPYNDTISGLQSEVQELEYENACLNRIIRELTKRGIKKPPAPLPPEPEEHGEEWETPDYCKKGKVLKINGKKS